MFTKTQDGKFTRWTFQAKGTTWHVMFAPTAGGYWTVYRDPQGMQRNLFGRTFHSAPKMVAHYKSVAAELAAVVDDWSAETGARIAAARAAALAATPINLSMGGR